MASVVACWWRSADRPDPAVHDRTAGTGGGADVRRDGGGSSALQGMDGLTLSDSAASQGSKRAEYPHKTGRTPAKSVQISSPPRKR